MSDGLRATTIVAKPLDVDWYRRGGEGGSSLDDQITAGQDRSLACLLRASQQAQGGGGPSSMATRGRQKLLLIRWLQVGRRP